MSAAGRSGRRAWLFISSLALLGTAATGCSAASGAQPADSDPPPQSPPVETCSAPEQIAAWPLEQRVSQLLFAGVNTNRGVDPDPLGGATTAVSQGVGGLNFLGTNTAVYSAGQLHGIKANAAVPPFLTLDQEGGRVQRLQGVGVSIPSARELGATRTPDQIRELGAWVGFNMADLGFNMNFAPNVDVSSQPNGAVAGDRSFDADPTEVTADAGAFAEGLRRYGIVPVLKHFPGLGSASGNTDFQTATTPPLSAMLDEDLVPYEALTADRPVAVMMASAEVPGLTEGVPAGLSPQAVSLLREGVGFDGVILTDSLDGKAITSRYTVEDAAVLALAAGNDMVLWDHHWNVPAVRAAILAALADGRLDEAKINASVARVLALKQFDPCADQD